MSIIFSPLSLSSATMTLTLFGVTQILEYLRHKLAVFCLKVYYIVQFVLILMSRIRFCYSLFIKLYNRHGCQSLADEFHI
ncbi:hypothetical protein [Vibrio alfacsensis]|uniref:hypothetical protein n=1 Tax=Vibrio alfacsensis TaxID=1074311 RepID=UPI001C81075D|nr:hypothetical protein [Vibrio alfacsensis]